MMHECSWRVRLAAVATALSIILPAHARAQSNAAVVPELTDAVELGRRLVLVGLECGAVDVDLPHPERPGESFGRQFRLGLQAGYEFTHWLEVDAEVGFSFLGESDSLNAILVAQGGEAGAAYTLVDFGIGVVGRWPLGSGRFAPFVRASGGLASLALSWPEGGARETDPAWSAGGGLEFSLARPVVLRLQGRWMGQREDDGTTRSHGTAELAAFYAFHTANFVVPPVTTSP